MAKTAGEVKNAGIHHVSIGRINSSYTHMGSAADPNTIANATTLNALHVSWADSFVPAQPTPAVEKTQGGNQPGPSIILGISDQGEATLTLAMENETLSALIEGVTIDTTTVSDWLMTGHNPRYDTFYNYIVIVSSKVEGDGIALHWINKIYLNAELRISAYMGASQAAGTNSHMVTITILPDDSTKTPYGSLLSTTNMAFTDHKTSYLDIRTDAPLSMTTHVADTGETTFILGFRPTSTDVLEASQIFSKNGTATNPTSVVVATGVVTIPEATAADEWVALYETNFVAI